MRCSAVPYRVVVGVSPLARSLGTWERGVNRRDIKAATIQRRLLARKVFFIIIIIGGCYELVGVGIWVTRVARLERSLILPHGTRRPRSS